MITDGGKIDLERSSVIAQASPRNRRTVVRDEPLQARTQISDFDAAETDPC